VLGRKLTCHYGNDFNALWPTYNHCELRWVDLSESYKTVKHSFSGTAAQKAAVSVVWFKGPAKIDFLPKSMLNVFPRLNGIRIVSCETLTTIRENFFGQDFNVIQYLSFYDNEIATIEANAFQHLPNLKWISLQDNQLSSLPHQIFKNNPELIAIWFDHNKINSITPDFFKNLNKLQRVGFTGNQCIKEEISCWSESCSVTQEELDSGFSNCYKNCLEGGECATKSGKLDNSKQNETLECDAKKFEEISQDLKTLKEDVKVQQETIESLGNNLTLLIEAHDFELKSLKQELAALKTKLEDRTNDQQI
jgi:hypothetical protein